MPAKDFSKILECLSNSHDDCACQTDVRVRNTELNEEKNGVSEILQIDERSRALQVLLSEADLTPQEAEHLFKTMATDAERLTLRCVFKLPVWEQLLNDVVLDHEVKRRCIETISGIEPGYSGPEIFMLPQNIVNHLTPEEERKIWRKLAEDLEVGRIIGPFSVHNFPFSKLRLSPMACAPKGLHDVRTITNYSAPFGGVNKYIAHVVNPYDHFDDLLRVIVSKGKGCLLWKADVKSAFRQLLIAAIYLWLQGITCCNGKIIFLDRCGPFGSRYATDRWEDIGAAIVAIMIQKYGLEYVFKWVDDLTGVNRDQLAFRDFEAAQKCLKDLGVPYHKLIPPTTNIIVVGIGIDTCAFRLYVPNEKKQEFLTELMQWRQKRETCLNEVQQLFGSMNYLSKAVRSGKAFCIHIKVLLSIKAKLKPKQKFRIPRIIRDDIRWWTEMLPKWKGSSVLWDVFDWNNVNPVVFYTDACVTGYGGVMEDGRHVAGTFTQSLLDHAKRSNRLSIPYLEGYCVCLMICTLLEEIKGRFVRIYSDCEVFANCVNNVRCTSTLLAELLRYIFMECALHDICIQMIHLPGEKNVAADHLSRGRYDEFRRTKEGMMGGRTMSVIIPTALSQY